jgi:hypothetical protein
MVVAAEVGTTEAAVAIAGSFSFLSNQRGATGRVAPLIFCELRVALEFAARINTLPADYARTPDKFLSTRL